MTYHVQWTLKAAKQAKKVPKPDRDRIVASVGELEDWPGCIAAKDIKPLKRHQYSIGCAWAATVCCST
jgi:mRNA-degrading endonuclease RelE of RelBE toxin-antitoxin system